MRENGNRPPNARPRPYRADKESDAETLASLRATSTNDGATATSPHADEESVGSLATHDGWLIGPFHRKTLLRETRDYSGTSTVCQGQFSIPPCG
jgi:hypothetical protein